MLQKFKMIPGVAILAMAASGMAIATTLVAQADTVGPITFEPPAYTTGIINAQKGWSSLGAAGSGCAVYDHAVSDNSTFPGAPTSFGTQSLRISNAVVSGCFGDQTFSPSLMNEAGETDATSSGYSGGVRQPHFEAQFDIASVVPNAEQPGLFMSVSPDRGDGARMSYLGFEDESDGIHVLFYDVTDPTHAVNADTFNESDIATLDRTSPHTIKFSMDFLNGPDNDVVKIYIDGNLVHTGTSWEDYYRYDTESQGSDPSLVDVSRTVDSLLFRTGGTEGTDNAPATAGKGFLIDGLSLESGPIPPQTYTVTIDKFIDGKMATGAEANGAAFPMASSWNAANLGGSGSGSYTLGTTGFNSPNAYEAVTSPMNAGSSYTTNEVTGGAVVGSDCAAGDPFALIGYSTGATLADAQSASISTAAPNFADLESNEYVIVWNKDCLSAPTLLSPVNGTITTTANLTSVSWNPVTDVAGGITYVYQASNSSTTNPDGSFVSPVYTSGSLSATNIPTPGTPADVYFWHVQAKDADGNVSPWSDAWTFTVDNSSPEALATCPDGATPTFVETDTVNSANSSPTLSAASLSTSTTYLLVSSGVWQNGGLNAADTAFASVDNWTTHMQGYNIAPYLLGSGEFQLQVDGQFVNWGGFQPTHQYAYLYTGTGAPVSLMVFDGDSTAVPPVANPGWYGDNSGNVSVNIYSCGPTTGSLTVEKDTIGGDGKFNFTSNVPGGSSFSITTASGTGNETFANITPGTYTVTEATPPKGWTETDTTCSSVQVTAGGTATCVITNTANSKLGEIRGTKYVDKDGDHHRLAGVTIYLDTNNNGALDAGEPSTVTNKFGEYRFSNLPAGTYHVREVEQAGWIETVPASGSYTIKLAAGKVSRGNNFADFKLGTISGLDFNDANGNGHKDGGETGLAGWTITLTKLHSSFATTTVTDANGNYSFANLGPGSYRVTETTKTGWYQTTGNPPTTTIDSGDTVTNENFGNHYGKVTKNSWKDWGRRGWE